MALRGFTDWAGHRCFDQRRGSAGAAARLSPENNGTLKTVYLSLGSNVGDREDNLGRALECLEQKQVRITARSSWYETEPQDVVDQPWFLNLVVACETSYFPLQLLTVLRKIERELGRIRDQGAVRRGPRTIDIDILLFGSTVMDTPRLSIPHPRMLGRRFVLEPLLEIAPRIRNPANNEPLRGYLKKVVSQQLRKRT